MQAAVGLSERVAERDVGQGVRRAQERTVAGVSQHPWGREVQERSGQQRRGEAHGQQDARYRAVCAAAHGRRRYARTA